MKPQLKHSAISIALALAFAPTTLIAAQSDTDNNEAKIEKIEVTGSRIKRADFEGVAPVTVISADDIANSGLTSIAEVLQSSVANTGGSLIWRKRRFYRQRKLCQPTRYGRQ